MGYSYGGTIYQSYSVAIVSGQNYVGGLLSSLRGSGVVKESYAMGNVDGDSYVGGLIGHVENGGIANQSYSIGNVDGNSNTGGAIGSYTNYTTSNVKNIYWDVETSGQNSSSAGVGLTTEQMIKNLPLINMAGFDFSTVWRTTDGYPILQWQPEEMIANHESDLTVSGKIETMIADVTIPSASPDLVINPNLSEGSVPPEFNITNNSVSPIKLELKTFEQTTDTFNDVLPSKYDSWEGLNKKESQDIALGLVAKESEGWQILTTPTSYVAGHSEHEIGIIKPTSTVDFNFDVKHGTAFSEAKTVQYKMVFVFDLLS